MLINLPFVSGLNLKLGRCAVTVLALSLSVCGFIAVGDTEVSGVDGIEWRFSTDKDGFAVVIRHGVHKIRDGAFAGCKRLKALALPGSLCFLGNRAFIGCQALESMTIPRDIQEIGDGLFSGCDSLKSVEITGNVTNVGSRAFFNCGSLESICLPDTVARLGEEAFLNCSRLRSVKLSFLGNKPECDGEREIYALTSNTLVTVVSAGSLGWGMDKDGTLPKTWQGRELRYADHSVGTYPTIRDRKGIGK
ncbi:MAG: leucine-rich repeat domain-containing protein [Kiritimatiellae bacterium]|nr:leucine-rich repeat domain-containing protein [Kiritimatiellia bacterium]